MVALVILAMPSASHTASCEGVLRGKPAVWVGARGISAGVRSCAGKLPLRVHTADTLCNCPGTAGEAVLELLFWLNGQVACTAPLCMVMGADAEAPVASGVAVGVCSCGHVSRVSCTGAAAAA